MLYITQDDYRSFSGEIPENFERLAEIASEQVNAMAGYKIAEIDSLPVFVQERVKKAVCSQVKYLDDLGGMDSVSGADGLQSATVGRFSFTAKSADAESGYSPLVELYLSPTGLLYHGIEVM